MMKLAKYILIPILLLATACSRSGGSEHDWDMDPRMADIGAWAHVCAFEAADLDPSKYPVSPIKGVDEPWGENNAFGTFYWPSRRTQVQITRPYAHLINIVLHEDGHYVMRIKNNGRSGGTEADADAINNACRENVRPGIYPAPEIDWAAK